MSTIRPRRRFIELHEQPWTPAYIRQPVQDLLTVAWTKRFWPIQSQSPSRLVGDVLGRVLEGLQGGEEEEQMRVVDFCSGAGGPLPAIEKSINLNRTKNSLQPIPFLLTDLHPHPSAWSLLSHNSSSLSYIPTPVDATNAPRDLLSASSTVGLQVNGDKRTKHFRTFFLAFHHFDEVGARKVLADAMEGADGIGIFELQEFNLGSLFAITMLGPMSWVTTPFLRPNLITLFFTYLLPIIPFILIFDGYISAYRTRSFSHIKHLAALAQQDLEVRGSAPVGGKPWVWERGSEVHTQPGGRMYWIVGKRGDL